MLPGARGRVVCRVSIYSAVGGSSSERVALRVTTVEFAGVIKFDLRQRLMLIGSDQRHKHHEPDNCADQDHSTRGKLWLASEDTMATCR